VVAAHESRQAKKNHDAIRHYQFGLQHDLASKSFLPFPCSGLCPHVSYSHPRSPSRYLVLSSCLLAL
jgi:hypothetical protein